MKNYLFLLIVLFFCLTSFTKPSADLIIYNANIYTANDNQPQAQVLVIHKGKFLEVGKKDLLNWYYATTKIDAKGKYIYPGFIDAHCHFTGYALDNYKLNLYESTSFQDMMNRVLAYSKTSKRKWIEGRMWNETNWTQREMIEINKQALDSLFPSRPVFLLRSDAHAALCNQQALDIAEINLNTKIDGGEIQQKNNQLTGMLFDNAIKLVKSKIPAIDEATAIEYYQKTEQEFFENGVTSFVDCMVENSWWKWLQNAYLQKKISINSFLFLTTSEENYRDVFLKKQLNLSNSNIAGFKIFADGSLGSRGAYLLNDYDDKHNHKGYLSTPISTIDSVAKLLLKTNYQLAIHAIGDAANHEVLKIYAKYLSENNNRRWRIEHAQIVDEKDFYLFKKHKIIPSVQPTHATSDMLWASERIGNVRIKNAYAYKKLLQQNKWLPLGTDFPVEYLNPLYTFCAAVFRQDKNQNPTNGFQKENALTRHEALKGMTIWAAKSVFKEKELGSIEVGKNADFVFLSTDLMKADLKKIYESKIEKTYLNGKQVYYFK